VRRGRLVPLTERVAGAAWLGTIHGRVTWSGGRGWSIDTGVMVEPSTLVGDVPIAPWLLARVPLTRGLTARGGFDLSRQTPDLDQVVGTFKAADPRPERARQFEVALEQQVGASLRWQVGAYHRREDDILRLEDNEPRLVNGQVERPSLAPYWANALEGWSRGVEVLLQRRAPTGLSGWVGYAYGQTRYTDRLRSEEFWGDYDQRHTFNAFALYRLTPRSSVSGKLRAASNFPIPGYFQRVGNQLWLAPERNLVRLPRYARLDLRANHTFTFDRRRLTLFVEVVNLTGRENFAADYPRVQPDGHVSNASHSLFPFLPSAGFMVDF
jgi:outer membrane receptor protein involved in Fe transport